MLIPESTIHSNYIFTPHSCMVPPAYGCDVSGKWLNSAIPLDVFLISDASEVADIVDSIFRQVILNIEANGGSIKTRSKKAHLRLRQTVQAVLLNLYFAYLLDAPVRYFRDKNRYVKKKRYGKIFYQYERVIATVDSLRRLNFVCHKSWVNDRQKGFSRTSRMWAAPDLIRLFHMIHIHQPGRVSPAAREELIELRIKKNKQQHPIDYKDTARIKRFRENLHFYNDFIGRQVIKIQTDGDPTVSLNQLSDKLYKDMLRGDLTITDLQVNNYNMTGILPINESYKHSVSNRNNNKNTTKVYESNMRNKRDYSMTHTFFDYTPIIEGLRETKSTWWSGEKYISTVTALPGVNRIFLPLLKVIIRKNYRANRLAARNRYDTTEFADWYYEQLNKEKIPLVSFGIQQLGFTVNSTSLHRVFNCGRFDKGGRFYGAYQTLPKRFRRHVKINSEPTIELDYSAHHIRIAYHREDIDYREDPYLAVTGDPKERKVFKLLLLVVMNAVDEPSTIRGFRNSNRDKLKELLGDLKNATIKPLLERVKKAHPKIAKYLHSGVGVDFQNIDSRITEGILMEMTRQGVPCLPIHDSYIVPGQYLEQLNDVMVAEYKKVMGFKPVIG